MLSRHGEGGTVLGAIAALRRGEPVVVADGEDRENEGDLILPAGAATPAALAFMVRHTSGVICAGMTADRLDALDIPLMVPGGGDAMGTAFTISVDYRSGTTTGISAADRALTLKALADPAAAGADFARPGHIFPLRARPGGVLERPGHTEAAVDLSRLAGWEPVGALAEIVNDDGTMARRDALRRFAGRHGLVMITIDDIVRHRRLTEPLVVPLAQAPVATSRGRSVIHAYASLVDGREQVAVVYGEVGMAGRDTGETPAPAPLVRVHSECLTGDLFDSARCDCGPQLMEAKRRISAEGRGVIIYVRGHEGRGIGLAQKLAAYRLQDEGADTAEANEMLGLPVDARSYDEAAQILLDLGLSTVRLLTNNAEKCAGLSRHGIAVERVPLRTGVTRHNRRYLDAKLHRFGHDLDVTLAAASPHCGTGMLNPFAW